VLSSNRFHAVASTGEIVLPSRSTLTSGSYMCRRRLSAIVPPCVCGSIPLEPFSCSVPQTSTSSFGLLPCGLPCGGFLMPATVTGVAPDVAPGATVGAAACDVAPVVVGAPAAVVGAPAAVVGAPAGLVAAVVAVGAVLPPPQAART